MLVVGLCWEWATCFITRARRSSPRPFLTYFCDNHITIVVTFAIYIFILILSTYTHIICICICRQFIAGPLPSLASPPLLSPLRSSSSYLIQYCAYGALGPFFPIYYSSVDIPSWQIGILMGISPFVPIALPPPPSSSSPSFSF